MVSHLPAMLPVAVGCALAFRVRNEPRVALGWLGDGGSARGDAHEAMNLAGVRRLPIVFVLDNNGFAYSTPAHLEYGVTHLAERAAAYGFPGQVVDGTDVVAVYRAAQEAIERARGGGGPTLLELVTLRMEGHAVHDDAFYVPPELLAAWRERDPIARARARLLAPRRRLRRGRRRGAPQRGRARGRRGRRARPGQRVARSGDAHRRRLPLSRARSRRGRARRRSGLR